MPSTCAGWWLLCTASARAHSVTTRSGSTFGTAAVVDDLYQIRLEATHPRALESRFASPSWKRNFACIVQVRPCHISVSFSSRVRRLGWYEVVDAFMQKWNSIHVGLASSLVELEDNEGEAGILHAAVARGHADCVAVLMLHGFTRYVAQCCVVAATKGDEMCLARLLLYTSTVGGSGGLDALLRMDVLKPPKARQNPSVQSNANQDDRVGSPHRIVDITLLLHLLAALCVWHNMVDPLVAICVAALEAGVSIGGCICILDECELCLSPAAAAPLWSLFAESPLLRNRVTTSPLHIAAAHGSTAAVVVLLSVADTSNYINSLDSEHQTALMWSMRSRCISIAKLLLIAGADVSVGQDAVSRHLAGRNTGNRPSHNSHRETKHFYHPFQRPFGRGF